MTRRAGRDEANGRHATARQRVCEEPGDPPHLGGTRSVASVFLCGPTRPWACTIPVPPEESCWTVRRSSLIIFRVSTTLASAWPAAPWRPEQSMTDRTGRLADRLGVTTHASPLRYKLLSLQKKYPSSEAACLEDWLIDVANARGAHVVSRDSHQTAKPFTPPPEQELSNSELVAAICQPQCLDRPQMLRLAAQLVSRKAIDLRELIRVARRERCARILAEMARQALQVEAQHETWQEIQRAFAQEPGFRQPVIHWSRLAWPVMRDGRCNASEWRLLR